VISSLDRLVTAKVVSLDMVTTLTLTGRMYSLSGGLLYQITETARPMLGQMIGANKMSDALRSYRHLFAISTGAAVVAAASMWAGNGSFVARWVGAGNYGGVWLDLALAFNVILNYWVLPNRAILSANLSVRSQTLSRIVEGTLNLPLLTARMFNRPFARFLWEDASPTLALLGCLAIIAPFVRQLAGQIGGYEGAAAGIFLTAAAGTVLLWFIVLDKSVRARIIAILGQIGLRARAQLTGASQ
jgi:hypothetical protein